MSLQDAIHKICTQVGVGPRDPKSGTLRAALLKVAELRGDDFLVRMVKHESFAKATLPQLLKVLSDMQNLDGDVTEEFLETPWEVDEELAKFIGLKNESAPASEEGAPAPSDKEDDLAFLDEEDDEEEDAAPAFQVSPKLLMGIGAVLLAVIVLFAAPKLGNIAGGSSLLDVPEEANQVDDEISDANLIETSGENVLLYYLWANPAWAEALDGYDVADGFTSPSLSTEAQDCGPIKQDGVVAVFKIVGKPDVVGYRSAVEGRICYAPETAFIWSGETGPIPAQLVPASEVTDILAALDKLTVESQPWSIRGESPISKLARWFFITVLLAGAVQLIMKEEGRKLFFIVGGLGLVALAQFGIPAEATSLHAALYFGGFICALGYGSVDGQREAARHALENVADLGEELTHRYTVLVKDRSFVMATEWTLGIWWIAYNLFLSQWFQGDGSLAALTSRFGGLALGTGFSMLITAVLGLWEAQRRHKLAYYTSDQWFRMKDYASYGLSIAGGIAAFVAITFFSGDINQLQWILLFCVLVPFLATMTFGLRRLGEWERVLDALMETANYCLYALLFLPLLGG